MAPLTIHVPPVVFDDVIDRNFIEHFQNIPPEHKGDVIKLWLRIGYSAMDAANSSQKSLELDQVISVMRLQFEERIKEFERHTTRINEDRIALLEQKLQDSRQARADLEQRFAQNLDFERQKCKLDARETMMDEVREARAAAMSLQNLLDQVQNGHVSVLSSQLTILHAELAKKTSELERFRSTNTGKGVEGEWIVRDYVEKHALPEWHVTDSSRVGHCGDIRVGRADGKFFVIEVKHTGTISKTMIDKSKQDHRTLQKTHGNNYLGMAFVSLRSKIPHLGVFNTVFDDKKPMMYISFSDSNPLDMNDRYLFHLLYCIEQIGLFLSTDCLDENVIFELVASSLASIETAHDRIVRLRDLCNQLRTELESAESDMLNSAKVLRQVLTQTDYYRESRRKIA